MKEDVLVMKKWRQAQLLADHIRNRFLIDYIPASQERKPRQNADIGDLAQLIDECLPREKWHLGRITGVVHSRDGIVRTVKVKTETSSFRNFACWKSLEIFAEIEHCLTLGL